MNNFSSSDETSMDGDVSDWSDVSEEAEDLLTQADQEEVAIHPGRPKKQKVTVNPPIPIELIPSRKRMKNGDISFLEILEEEVYKRSEQPSAEGIQYWRCIKHSEGCKMVIDTNRADLCVGRSKTRHSHCTAKVDLDIRVINSRIPILATQNQTWIRQDGARSMFPISLWNCFALTLDGKSGTTNSLEAWHNSLKLALATVDGKKPRFGRWHRQMKQECSLMEAQIVLLQGTPKKLKLVDQRIARQRLNIARAYNREEILDYLRKQSDFTVLEQF